MSLGPIELLVLLCIALLLFGPSRLPGLGRSLGDAMRGFKDGLSGSGGEARVVSEAKQIENSNSSISQNESDREKHRV